MYQRSIILSAFLFFFLPCCVFSKPAGQNESQLNRMEALAADLSVLSADLAEWNMATGVFIARLNAIVEIHLDRSCPPDFEGLLDELDSFASEIEDAQQSAANLKERKNNLLSALESARRQGNTTRVNTLNSRIATLDARLFKIESKGAVIHPDWLKAFRQKFEKYATDTCPDDMIYIEGTFCIDRFEYPNREDSIPAMNVTYGQAAKACHALGRRLCTESEWSRACRGPDCLYNHEAITNIKPSDCNTGLDLFTRTAPYPSGSRPECDTTEDVAEIFGNVWEWTSQTTHGNYRIVRGGAAHRDYMFYCGNSTWAAPGARKPHFGFRCCADPGPPPPPKPAAPPAPATGTAGVDSSATAPTPVPDGN